MRYNKGSELWFRKPKWASTTNSYSFFFFLNEQYIIGFRSWTVAPRNITINNVGYNESIVQGQESSFGYQVFHFVQYPYPFRNFWRYIALNKNIAIFEELMILSITIHILIVRQFYSYTCLQCHISYNYKTFNVLMTAIMVAPWLKQAKYPGGGATRLYCCTHARPEKRVKRVVFSDSGASRAWRV